MRYLSNLRRRLKRDTRGMALVEFAMVVIPLLIMLLGAFDLGYQSYVRAVAQGALNEIARAAAVENPQFDGTGTIEERIENALKERINDIARDATYQIEQTNFFEFSGVGNAEKLLTDHNDNGQYDAGDDDCFEDLNGNRAFDLNAGRDGLGGADDVVFYQVTITMPRLVPVTQLIGVPDDYTIAVQTAIRNQPYANQATPPVECGV